jgi:hypothetical protein
MIVELVAILALFVGGCALLRGAGLSGWGLLPLGFIAGLCLELIIGSLQIVLFLPTYPVITLILTAGLPLVWWAWRLRRGADVGLPIGWSALTLVGLGGAVWLLSIANLVKHHTDSIYYLMPAWLLADNSYRTEASAELVFTRLFGAALMHAPADIASPSQYLRSVTPLLAAATLGAVVWLFARGVEGRIPRSRLVLFGALGAVLLLSTNRFIYHAFYLNGHLLFATLLLVIAGAGWLRVRTAPLSWLQLLAIPALIVTRPEGFLVAGLALLPTLLSARIPRRHRARALAVYGVSCLALHAFLGWVHLDRGLPVSGQVVGGFVVGVAALAAVRFLGAPALLGRSRLVLLAVEGMIWLGLIAFVAWRPSTAWYSARATYINFMEGVGLWGYSAVVLGLLVVAALVLFGFRDQVHLRYPLTTFVPLALLLAYLREGGYRTSQVDSLVRMVIQFVPLALLLVIAAFALSSVSRELDEPNDEAGVVPEPVLAGGPVK